MTRNRGIILGMLAVTMLGWWWWWRSAWTQAPRAFAALAEAIAHGDARGVLDRVHHDYDAERLWPSVAAEGGLAGGRQRLVMLAGLRQVFAEHETDPILVDWQLHEVHPQDDGSVVAIVSLRLRTPSGDLRHLPRHALDHHRFVLARDGWGAALSLRDHDPIALTSDE